MVMLSSLKHGLHLESISIFCGASLWLNPSEKQKNKFKMGFHMSFLSRTGPPQGGGGVGEIETETEVEIETETEVEGEMEEC